MKDKTAQLYQIIKLHSDKAGAIQATHVPSLKVTIAELLKPQPSTLEAMNPAELWAFILMEREIYDECQREIDSIWSNKYENTKDRDKALERYLKKVKESNEKGSVLGIEIIKREALIKFD